MLGDQILGTGREDRDRHAGALVEQGRDRAVAADGDQAPARAGLRPIGLPAPLDPRASRRSRR